MNLTFSSLFKILSLPDECILIYLSLINSAEKTEDNSVVHRQYEFSAGKDYSAFAAL